MPAHLFGIPTLPLWYYQESAQQSTAVQPSDSRSTRSNEDSAVIYLARIHAALAAALSVVVVIHIAVVIRERVRRRQSASRGTGKTRDYRLKIPSNCGHSRFHQDCLNQPTGDA